jgi:polysaccharide export outer membrane protein
MKSIVLLLLLCLPALVVGAPTASINSIALTTDAGSYEVHIRGKGVFQCDKVFLDDPPRIALDFSNVESKLSSKNIFPKANAYVDRISVFQFWKENQKVLRIVVDLKAPFAYSVTESPDEMVLSLRSETAPGGTVGQPGTGVQSGGPGKPTASGPSTPPRTSAAAASAAIDLVIGPEDLLDINVFELPQFTVTTRVSGDGTITMPLIGSIQVGGLSKKQAERKIADALEAKYVNNANVSVTIKEYKSRQVSLLGAVKLPGPYYIISQRNLLQLLSEAGGLAADAGKKCFIFRPGSPRIEVDLGELMNGNEAFNVAVLPGDVINIPPERKVVIYVLGAVRNPGAVELSGNMPVTLLAAIARAGGPNEQANKSDIKIRRKDPDTGEEVVIKANLKDIISGKTPDLDLMPGDVVNVPESFF